MTQTDNLLRCLVNGDKEAVITAVSVTPTPTLFESQLVNGFFRKKFFVYAYSGECFYGYDPDMTESENSRPIPAATVVETPVSANIPVYFACVSGETGDIRVEEIS